MKLYADNVNVNSSQMFRMKRNRMLPGRREQAPMRISGILRGEKAREKFAAISANFPRLAAVSHNGERKPSWLTGWLAGSFQRVSTPAFKYVGLRKDTSIYVSQADRPQTKRKGRRFTAGIARDDTANYGRSLPRDLKIKRAANRKFATALARHFTGVSHVSRLTRSYQTKIARWATRREDCLILFDILEQK